MKVGSLSIAVAVARVIGQPTLHPSVLGTRRWRISRVAPSLKVFNSKGSSVPELHHQYCVVCFFMALTPADVELTSSSTSSPPCYGSALFVYRTTTIDSTTVCCRYFTVLPTTIVVLSFAVVPLPTIAVLSLPWLLYHRGAFACVVPLPSWCFRFVAALPTIVVLYFVCVVGAGAGLAGRCCCSWTCTGTRRRATSSCTASRTPPTRRSTCGRGSSRLCSIKRAPCSTWETALSMYAPTYVLIIVCGTIYVVRSCDAFLCSSHSCCRLFVPAR